MAKNDVLEAAAGTSGGQAAGKSTVPSPAPVLAVGLGRGFGGKSTLLAELAWRAMAAGRPVIVADGDARSRTLSDLFPDAVSPSSEELPDVKAWLSSVLNAMVKEKRSAVLDLGGGDRVLLEYGRDLKLVEFCSRRGIEPLAIYVLGPESEDLRHCVSIWEAGYFNPKRLLLVLNEGVIRDGRTVAGAFEGTMNDRGFRAMVEAGAKSFLLTRLACMDEVREHGLSIHDAASGLGPDPLDPVQSFMAEDWLDDLDRNIRTLGISGWLP
jgi:hypothetical protein